MPEYIPGECNIGPEEIQRRRRVGLAGILTTVGILGVLYVINANPVLALLLFFPAAAAAIGLLQAGAKFCAFFGIRGVYNVAYSVGHTDTVAQAEFRKIDRRKALQILLLGLVISIAAALLSYGLLKILHTT